MTNINDVTGVYANILKQAQGTAQDAGAAGGGPSFGDLLKTSVQNSIDTQYNSEKVSAAAVAGKAELTDVIEAVGKAEMALNMTIAVRDRVVQAYNQIMRMPI